MSHFLSELSWKEVEALKPRRPIILLPIGATEAHGPHLPLGTDVLLSVELAQRVAIALPNEVVLIAPPLAYSVTEYAAEFSGTISISPAVARALVVEICGSLIAQGLECICFINSHLEPGHVEVLRAAVAEVKEKTGRTVAFPDQLERKWARTLSEEFKRGACHAGSYETSLLLSAGASGALVKEEIRKSLPPRPIDLAKLMKSGVKSFGEAGATEAYFGDPSAASSREGEELYARLLEMVLATLKETQGQP